MRLTIARVGWVERAGISCISLWAALLAFCPAVSTRAAAALAATAAGTHGRHGAAAADQIVEDDSFAGSAKDLQLSLENARKAEAASHFMYGLMLEDSATTDQALDEYLKALALDPANVDLSIKLAWEYLRRADTPAAVNLLKDTIKAAPKQVQPCLALSYLYFNSLNKTDLAQKYALQALEIDPANIDCYEYLKEIYKAAGQPQKIAPLLDRAAKGDSKDPAFWLQLGALYIASLKGAEVPTGEDLKKTDAVFEKALACGNADADIVEKIAEFYVATQQLAQAIPLYKRAIELDPSRNLALENLARCYIDTGAKDLAIATLEDLIKADPVQQHAYALLGQLYDDAKQYDKAVANYEQSLLITPNHWNAYENLTFLLLDHFKQPEKAVNLMTEARKRFPDQPRVSYLLAVSLEQAKQHQQALQMFEQTIVEAQSVEPGMLNAGFYLQYGETAEQAGLFDKAAQLIKKSLETQRDPEQIAVASNYLGYMWVDHNLNVEEGGALIKRALEIDPDNGAYLDSLGWYYYRSGQFDKAVAPLERAIAQLKPEDALVYEHLGDAYLKVNAAAKAVDCWQKAIKLDPDNTKIPELNKKIAETKVR